LVEQPSQRARNRTESDMTRRTWDRRSSDRKLFETRGVHTSVGWRACEKSESSRQVRIEKFTVLNTSARLAIVIPSPTVIRSPLESSLRSFLLYLVQYVSQGHRRRCCRFLVRSFGPWGNTKTTNERVPARASPFLEGNAVLA
jgi:hypothetical protein